MAKLIARNYKNFRIGESHHRAKITDHDVELIRELHNDHKMTYETIFEKFEGQISMSLISKICRFERRAQTPEAWEYE